MCHTPLVLKQSIIFSQETFIRTPKCKSSSSLRTASTCSGVFGNSRITLCLIQH